MSCNNKGSVLLVVVLVAAVVSVVLAQLWTQSVCTTAIARARITCEQQTQAVDALLYCAIAYAKANKDSLLLHDGAIDVSVPWPPVNGVWEGVFSIKKQDKSLALSAALFKEENKVSARSCQLVPKKEREKTVYVIHAWT